MSGGRFAKSGETVEVKEVPVIAANVRWERPTARSFWNALADPEREALAAAGVEQIFRAGSVLCRAGDVSSQVMIIDSGWVKVSVKAGAGADARRPGNCCWSCPASRPPRPYRPGSCGRNRWSNCSIATPARRLAPPTDTMNGCARCVRACRACRTPG